MELPKPAVIEIFLHLITGIVGGCAASLPAALKQRPYAVYIITAYAVIGAISAVVSGIAVYAFFPLHESIGLKAFVFAAAMGVLIPLVLLLVRSVIHLAIKIPGGAIDIELHRTAEASKRVGP